MLNSAVQHKTTPRLYTLTRAAEALGGISVWTLRGHIKRGTLQVVHIGKRVLLSRDTVDQIAREGLPSLGQAAAPVDKQGVRNA